MRREWRGQPPGRSGGGAFTNWPSRRLHGWTDGLGLTHGLPGAQDCFIPSAYWSLPGSVGPLLLAAVLSLPRCSFDL